MRNRWLRALTRNTTTFRRPERPRFRPSLGVLEDRVTPTVLTFQQGTAGYTGTQDTQVFSAMPTTNFGTDPSISVDQSDANGSREGLIRFDNIIGTGAGQIPLGSVINSATMTFNVTSATDATAKLGLNRMLADWNQATVTWNSFPPVGGIQGDGTDANFPADGLLGDPTSGAGKVIPVTAGVQAFANGAPNFGWAVLQDSYNGWDFDTSEGATVANRPLLTVDFTAPSGAGQFNFSAASSSISEGAATATVTVYRKGGTTGAVSVNFAATAGTATAGSDFTATSGTLNFANGDVSKTFTVPIIDDHLLEGTETVNLALSSPTGGAFVGTQGTAALNILDNDALLNEVDANTTDGSEYVELSGAANLPLTNVSFVVFNDTVAGNPGTAQMIVPLNTASLGSNGLLVIKSPTTGPTIPAATTLVGDARFNTAGGTLPDTGTTFALVLSISPLTQGTDYDPTDSGALTLPAGAQVLDSIGWTPSGNGQTDLVYGPRLIQPNGAPSAATRITGDSRANNLTSWYNGSLLTDHLTYDSGVGNSSTNLPAGGLLTPGAVNFQIAPPQAVTAVGENNGAAQRSNVTSIQVTFCSAPALTGTIAQEFTLTRTKLTGGAMDSTLVTIGTVSVSGNVVTLSGFSGAASLSGTGGSSLADGVYSLTVNAAFTGLSSNFTLADNGAVSSNSGSLFRLAGDLDGNRSIGGQDINLFVAGFGASGIGLPGDLNLDGSVGGNDINLFVASFGGSV